jgi:uncharacterized protein DUF4265
LRPANLRRVHVRLPNHEAVVGEYLWARALGRDLYELRSVPFGAYGLNYCDVVRATVDRPRDPPEIRFVVRRSGHRTIRVFLADALEETVTRALLLRLEALGIGYERGFAWMWALDLPPEVDIDVVRARLDEWRAGGLLDYETCEARQAGSFDGPPMPPRPSTLSLVAPDRLRPGR